MASKILIKRTATAGATPTAQDIDVGELAVNQVDKRVYFNNNGTIVELGTYPSSQTVVGNASIGGTLGVNGTATFTSGTAGTWTVTGTLTVPTPVNPTDAATKSYVDVAVSNVLDTAPDALNTLNELAAAINDDADFAGTITTLIGTKLNKAGDTMTGNLDMGTNKVTTSVDPVDPSDMVRKAYVDSIFSNLTAAEVSAAEALASEQAAATSASAASTSATQAASSETAAASSETASASSETSASSSASSASISATQASASATAAALSATQAADSEASAQTDAAYISSLIASAQNFEIYYLGTASSDPTVDGNGNALVEGALYFNTVDNIFKVYITTGSLGWVPFANSATSAEAAAYAAAANNSKIEASVIETSVNNVWDNVQTIEDNINIGIDNFVYKGVYSTRPDRSGFQDGETIYVIGDDKLLLAARYPISGNAYWYDVSSGLSTIAVAEVNTLQYRNEAESAATNAQTSATIAETYKNNAQTYASDAYAAKLEAEQAETNATSWVMGAFATAPQTSLTGAIYYNTTDSQLYIWSGSQWEDAAFSTDGGVVAFNGRTGSVNLSSADVTTALGFTPITSGDADVITTTELAVTGQGTQGQTLVSDGDGTFSWTDAASGGGSLSIKANDDLGTITAVEDVNASDVYPLLDVNAPPPPAGTALFIAVVDIPEPQNIMLEFKYGSEADAQAAYSLFTNLPYREIRIPLAQIGGYNYEGDFVGVITGTVTPPYLYNGFYTMLVPVTILYNPTGVFTTLNDAINIGTDQFTPPPPYNPPSYWAFDALYIDSSFAYTQVETTSDAVPFINDDVIKVNGTADTDLINASVAFDSDVGKFVYRYSSSAIASNYSVGDTVVVEHSTASMDILNANGDTVGYVGYTDDAVLTGTFKGIELQPITESSLPSRPMIGLSETLNNVVYSDGSEVFSMSPSFYAHYDLSTVHRTKGISSTENLGTGARKLNFINNAPDTNYVAVAQADNQEINLSRTTSSVTVQTRNASASSTSGEDDLSIIGYFK